jgi:hypothetical protein
MTMRYTPVAPAHQMHACGIHAREVRINHKRPYTGGRDLKLQNMSFCGKSLSTAATDSANNHRTR